MSASGRVVVRASKEAACRAFFGDRLAEQRRQADREAFGDDLALGERKEHDGDGGMLQTKQVADAVVLSQSATTRLVTRLEDRGLLARYLCPHDRRGIYTKVTDSGHELLEAARPTNATALREALTAASRNPELAPLVHTLESLRAPA
ncbi:MarR family winged helix-turn-helix transcriptional regulator [Nocardia sp. CA-151230]|uniref:MarR family winged helix-turn-helix transcriptional regulator n=1 Tax=Nocardia sp. CA-151230 TaxID=3239982 RepID=UPI003D8A1528